MEERESDFSSYSASILVVSSIISLKDCHDVTLSLRVKAYSDIGLISKELEIQLVSLWKWYPIKLSS